MQILLTNMDEKCLFAAMEQLFEAAEKEQFMYVRALENGDQHRDNNPPNLNIFFFWQRLLELMLKKLKYKEKERIGGGLGN
jgi:hypothetical protein